MSPESFFRISFTVLLSSLTIIRLYFKYQAGLLHEAVFPRTEKIRFIIYRAILGTTLLVKRFPNDYPHYQTTTPRFIPGWRSGGRRKRNGSDRR